MLWDFGEASVFLWASVFLSAEWKGLDLIGAYPFKLGHSLWVVGHWTIESFLGKDPWQSLSQKLGSFNFCLHTSGNEEFTTSQFFVLWLCFKMSVLIRKLCIALC